MARALALAKCGVYSTSPNPRVGCVLVKDNVVIAEAWHQKAGEGHAEANALLIAGDNAKGATAYITLEPCSHQGKTPPCANALIKSGIKQVVYAMQDPNPLVAGKGIIQLQAAGIKVLGPLLEQDAKELNKGFIKRMTHGLPWVFAKVASSIDGRTAMQSGESQWITGTAARADVQRLRARSCAIITGVGTVLQDDPALTVRDQQYAYSGVLRQPLRVIVDSQLQTPLTAKILQEADPVLIVYAQGNNDKLAALANIHIETQQLSDVSGRVDLTALLKLLAERQCNEVMIESGAKLLGAFIKEQLLDEMYLYMAPTFLGSSARPVAALPLEKMSEQLRWNVKELRQVGDDVRWQMSPVYLIDNHE